MRVLVAGATGVLAGSVLSMLRERGHQVIALVRDPSRASGLDAEETVVADGLDRLAMQSALLTARPDVVVHLMTALRGLGTRTAEALEVTARLRTEGTANLIMAAREVGARRLVAQSIAFAGAPRGGRVLDEDAPLYLDAPDPAWATTVQAVAELERLALGSPDITGVVLRYGTLYGAGTSYEREGYVGQAVLRGRFPIPDTGSGVTSFLHVQDAASATVTAVEADATGVLQVTDDDPAPASDWLPHYAHQLGAPPPRAVPARMAERQLGWFTTYQLTQLRGAANDRARAALDWKPSRPSWRAGLGHG